MIVITKEVLPELWGAVAIRLHLHEIVDVIGVFYLLQRSPR